MTLLVMVFAAVAATVLWYTCRDDSMRLGPLCWMYWGASLMWLADALFEYAELGAAYFSPEPAEMLNDLFLGLSAAALGLVIWLALLLIRDPKGVIRAALRREDR